MRLRWDYLIWGILFFAIFLFDPLLKAVGPEQTTIIICTGLIAIAVIKATEYKRGCYEDDDDDDDGI